LKKIILILVSIALSSSALCETLSNKAVFYRCYRQITQTFPKPNHPYVQQVVDETITPSQACINILNKALFRANSNNRISNASDKEAIAVLKTMHNLHYSWLTNKTIPNVADNIVKYTKNFVDVNGPALYFTKALFTPDYEFKNIFLGKKHYESYRTNNDPEESARGDSKSEFPRIKTPFQFVSLGDLLGVKEFTVKNVPYSEVNGGSRRDSRFSWDLHLGGGILGSNMYFMNNLNEQPLKKSNGTNVMPRKWTTTLVKDFLCRDVPVLRYSDTTPFIVNNSETEFRRDGACIRCHATMDRTAGLIRGVHYKARIMGLSSGEIQRLIEINNYGDSRDPVNGWSDEDDGSFYRRPSTGHFMYRTFDGKLIDKSLQNLEGLGATFVSLDDPYVCVAKRYYEYFTGVNANIDDIADPQYGVTLSSADIKHRNEVITLGKAFKSHQNVRTLIKNILDRPQFKESDFKIPSN